MKATSVKATSVTVDGSLEEIVDDISNLDMSKLAALRAKRNKPVVLEPPKKNKSLEFGIVGSGQAGARVAEVFYKLGYEAIVLNTASQDLRFIDVPESNKLLLEYGLGGAAKELEIGQGAAETHRDEISKLVSEKLSKSEVNILCLSLGGGSGAGSCDVLIELLSSLGKPLVVMTILPMDSEDIQTKSNSLKTLGKLAKYVSNKTISNLICVDNAKIESVYHDVSQMDFYGVANKAIVNPLHAFNTITSMDSEVKPLDPAEFSKIFIDGEGLSVYGEVVVSDLSEDTAIAEAIVDNVANNLLVDGFDLKQAKYAGFLLVANEKTWASLPVASINYAGQMIDELCGSPNGTFKGFYVVNMPENIVKVYSMFSGLGLPDKRVQELIEDVKNLESKAKLKSESRNLNLQLNTGTNETVSAAQKIKERIAAKSSKFGQLMGNSLDKRK